MTNVNPDNTSESADPGPGSGPAPGAAAGSGLPLRGLAMVLIAVAVLLAMWGVYATTQNSDSSGGAAAPTTEAATAVQESPGEGADAEDTTGAAESTRPEATERAADAEAETESESPESPGSPTSGAPAPAGAPPAPRGATPAADPERVHVLNNSTVPNLAADIAGTLDRDGYELGEVGNLAEVILPENTVFFQSGNQDAETRARELADRVGGVAREYDETLPDGTAGRNDLTLVLVEQVAL